jgi:penicillin-binding protein 1A
VTLLELTRAYGVFATLGKRFDPIFITRVTDDAGKPIDFADTKPRFERVMTPALAYLLTNMLETVITNGTGKAATSLGRPLAGKTGTTNESRDAWFIGYSPDLLAGAWVGYDSHEPLGGKETGARAALPIWMDFMRRTLEGRPPVDFPVPPGVTYASIDPASGLRAVPGGASIREVFIAGTEPQEFAPLPEPDVYPTDGEPALPGDLPPGVPPGTAPSSDMPPPTAPPPGALQPAAY